MDGQYFGQQGGEFLDGFAAMGSGAGSGVVDGVEEVADGEEVAQAGDVAGDGAVAEADEGGGVLAHLFQQFQVFHVGDGTFGDGDVHALGEFLGVGEGAVDDFHVLGEVQQFFVEVQKAHVAAGAATEPDGGEAQFFVHIFSPFIRFTQSGL